MKKRSQSQKIGEIGEASFKQFALKNSILPNKLEYDYGIDFICQPVEEKKQSTDTVPFKIFGANIKSTRAKSPKSRLNRDDVESSIQSTFPLVFILIDLKNEHYYYHFLTLGWLNKFYIFLKNEQKYFNLTPKKMILWEQDSQHFFKELNKIASKEYQDRLELKKKELQLSLKFPNTRLQISTGQNGNLAIIKLENIEHLCPKDTKGFKEIRKTLLASCPDTISTIPINAINTEILKHLEGYASKAMFVTEFFEKTQVLTIKNNKSILAQCVFDVRHFHDEFSFSHAGGVSIIMSERREHKSGAHHHYFEVLIGKKGLPVNECEDLLQFLSSCRKNTELYLKENDEIGIKISNFKALTALKDIAQNITEIYNFLSISPTNVSIPHFNNFLYSCSYGLLIHIIKSPKHIDKESLQGFTLDYPKDIKEIVWEKATIDCYLQFSLAETDLLLNFEFNGLIGFAPNHDNPIGIRFFNMLNLKQTNKIPREKISFPKLIINEDVVVEYGKKPRTIEHSMKNSDLTFKLNST